MGGKEGRQAMARGKKQKPATGAFVGGSLSSREFVSQARRSFAGLKEGLFSSCPPSRRGRAFVRSYTRLVDTMVGVAFQRAMQENDARLNKVPIAVLGMGGYGRAELAPYSDVDILVVCRRRTALAKRVAGSFIRLLWDVGFELGHSVQSLVESEGVLGRNMDTRTALIESRWICGSARIARAMASQVARMRKGDREAFLRRKVRDAVVRHRKYGESFQLIQPNVKLSPGGLRDFQTLLWLGMAVGGAKGLHALRTKGLLMAGEIGVLEEAYDFLIKTRVALHLATQSKEDQLTVRMQRVLAEQLGYGSSGDHMGVELFMRDYYRHTRTVFHIVRDIIEELDQGKDVGVLLGRKRAGRDGNVLPVRLDKRKLQREPLYVFFRQKSDGRRLSRATRRRLEEALHGHLRGAGITVRMRRGFARLIEDDSNLSVVLRTMHETGFLSRIIPEYEHLTCLKRYDLYHHYTADEHSFRVVENLEILGRAGRGSHNPLARLYSEIGEKRVILLTALLHDIGKIKGRGHARKGARLAGAILKRMGVDGGEAEKVAFLIEQHLIMSHFSQRRDPTEMGTLRSFCDRVGNRTNLKHLCLLTYADLKATSPVVWTRWKRTLLLDLYLRAHQFIAQKEKRPEAVYKTRKQGLLRAFPPGGERRRARAHLDLLPGRYLLTTRPSQLKRHLELIDRLDGRKGAVHLQRGKASAEVTFCTFDKPYRLSQLCGILTINDFNILFAHAFTRSDGRVIDTFQVEDLTGSIPIDRRRSEKLEGDLEAVLTGRMDIEREFQEHVARWRRRKVTSIPVDMRVEFDNDLSADFTIIDIYAADEPGLLYRVARVLSSEGLTIHRARISTEANRAIDAFYVRGRGGGKVRSAAKMRRIREKLRKEIG